MFSLLRRAIGSEIHDFTGNTAMRNLGIINRHIYRNLKLEANIN